MRSTLLTLALAGLASLTLSKEHSVKHHLKAAHHHSRTTEQSIAWPAVIFPYNIEYEVNAYKYNPLTHELTRDFDSGFLQYTDSTHNQQVISVLKTINGERKEIF